MFRFLAIILISILALGVPAQERKTKPDGATAAASATALSVFVPVFANTNCPIMGGMAKHDLFVDTDHGRIYMCCKGCIKKIQADPEAAYKKAYPKSTKLDNKICPVTNAPIEKGAPTISLQGYDVALGSKECMKEARDNAQTVLAKVLDPKVIVVGNRTCPVTGKAVDKGCVVLIGDHLVHLSSAAAVEDVRKAPKQMLDKALGKAGQSAPPPGAPGGKPDDSKKPEEPKKPGQGGHNHGNAQGSGQGPAHGHDCCHD